ncbi:MAG: helix-turn-helix domain-containing protein [Alphaproteobacteria bacterium]|nr:helix-turn-helix domain-containing protein [Alphaproteobacteria bacterium]
MAKLQEESIGHAEEATRKALFSSRLRTLMAEKGLTVTVLGKLIQEQLPEKSFNPVNISHYRSGRSLPRPPIMKALAHALDVNSDELAPPLENHAEAQPPMRGKKIAMESSVAAETLLHSAALLQKDPGSSPSFHLEDLSDGEAWIQINQRLSWNMVLKLLQVLKGEDGA